jgi:hypothetical protein
VVPPLPPAPPLLPPPQAATVNSRIDAKRMQISDLNLFIKIKRPFFYFS